MGRLQVPRKAGLEFEITLLDQRYDLENRHVNLQRKMQVSWDNPQHKYRIAGKECSAIRAGVREIITWMGPGTPVKQ